jgi:predicted metalloprotease with PDZ domain
VNPEGDLDRLAADVQVICETQIALFDHLPKEINYYCFLLHVSHEGYGGIEHVNSCSLLIHKFALPSINEPSRSKAYIELLGLFSHEYFHLWMVKQIKPAVFINYDLTKPNYTTQLWAFEGFTAYYDDLILVRAKLITRDQYFKILAENINKLFKTPGRKQQTLHSASFDAWIKFYKPDENSINSTVSYYLKGALLALCCDLQLRMAVDESNSLDNIMKLLWIEYGQKNRGVEENEIEALLIQFNKDLQALLTTGLKQTVELPIELILKKFGLALINNINAQALDFAAKLLDSHGGLFCQEVYQEGLLKAFGVQAGDILIACQSQRITYQNYQQLFQRYVNQRIELVIFREDKLKVLTGVLNPIFVNQLEIKLIPGFENNINKWLLDN